MNDDKQTTIRTALIEALLPGIEGIKPIQEVLTQAQSICLENRSERIVIKVADKLLALQITYDQGSMTDKEAQGEISSILILLT